MCLLTTDGLLLLVLARVNELTELDEVFTLFLDLLVANVLFSLVESVDIVDDQADCNVSKFAAYLFSRIYRPSAAIDGC